MFNSNLTVIKISEYKNANLFLPLLQKPIRYLHTNKFTLIRVLCVFTMNEWSTVPVQKLSFYLDNFNMHHSSNLIPIVIACLTAYLPRTHKYLQFSNSQIIAIIKIGVFMALTVTANCINFYTRLFMFPTSILFFVSLIDFHVSFPFLLFN